eukprot:CAMPEP_0184122814 /NCGR_PEP_ID=MMETSP0974-20121125/23683_1 /TAXON_ID=483370 /ORGANISM="non described non described, Strain CCMP2097" /LENGTH=79 /DNA_ID=CAMNT_0026426067 /DNA_START=84 /DNA_END=318 /DNA_ORIENTATION=+
MAFGAVQFRQFGVRVHRDDDAADARVDVAPGVAEAEAVEHGEIGEVVQQCHVHCFGELPIHDLALASASRQLRGRSADL